MAYSFEFNETRYGGFYGRRIPSCTSLTTIHDGHLDIHHLTIGGALTFEQDHFIFINGHGVAGESEQLGQEVGG